MILADLGANVIKVERPGNGDDTRTWGPPYANNSTESVYNLSVNRGKRSVCLDLGQVEGAALARRLALRSDVLLENFLPGKLARYQLDYPSLTADRPQLIYCSITGYGQSGPWAQRPGYDVTAAAIGGLLQITGIEDQPCRVGVAMTDLSTGLYAVTSIMAALLRQRQTGLGTHIDVNLLATQVASLTHIGANWLIAGKEGRRYGTAHPSIVPYQAFLTSDKRHLVIGVGNNEHFVQLCKRINRLDLTLDPRYQDNADRVKNRDALLVAISNEIARFPLSYWAKQLEGSSFPYGPVNSVEEVFDNSQVQHLGMRQPVNHPTLGRLFVPGSAMRFSDFRLRGQLTLGLPDGDVEREHLAPPLLGQHTEDVLRDELNLSESEINALRLKGVVQ